MESVKISPKKCKLAIALAGHHSGSITLTMVQKTAQLTIIPRGRVGYLQVNALGE